MEKYKLSVTDKRDRYSYLHPDRNKPINGKALGTNYDKKELMIKFELKLKGLTSETDRNTDWSNIPLVEYDTTYDYHADPIAILFVRSELRLVVDLQTCIKAQRSRAYARKVALSNLEEMAKTVVYIQEHGYNTLSDLISKRSAVEEKYNDSQSNLRAVNRDSRLLKDEIHYTKQYLATKKTYAQLQKVKNKKKFRAEHSDDIQAYIEARKYLQSINLDKTFSSLQSLTQQLDNLQKQRATLKQNTKYYKDYLNELNIVTSNIDAILDQPISRKHSKQREEESL